VPIFLGHPVYRPKPRKSCISVVVISYHTSNFGLHVSCAAAVRSASQLPAASHKHLVRAADGLYAVAESLEEVAAVDRLRTADAFVLHRLHHRARLQGRTA